MRLCAGCECALTGDNQYEGINKWCKSCWCERVRTRRRTNPAVQEYDRNRAKLPHRKEAARRITINWRADNPEKWAAHIAVNNALRAGKIKREPCLFCSDTKTHAHHTDYSKPLHVRWVCAKCHHRMHALLHHEAA